MKQRSWKTLSMLMLALASFTSCDDDENEMEEQRARLMVVHASPDAPAVDVRVNSTVALTGLSFPGNSNYTSVNAGPTNIRVSPAGTTTYVIDANVNLMANNSYSVFAIDSVSKIKPALVFDNLATPAAGKAHVRFFHFSPNAPLVDIALAGGSVLFANRGFNDQTTNTAAAEFTPVDAGSYNLEVRLAGETTVVLPLPNITLTAGKIYTVFAKGFVSGTGNQALGAQVIMHN